MKRASLLAAAAIVLIANAFALIHARRNRSGPVETDITLSEREVPLSYNANDEDSGVTLDFRWTDSHQASFPRERSTMWLDREILQGLGFDTAVAPSDSGSSEFYQRQRPRRAYVALEFDGPAWRKRVEFAEHLIQEHPNVPANLRQFETRLIAIDAGSDALRLRARHPDRTAVMILPAVVRIMVEYIPQQPPALSGIVQDVPSSIHVPRPFSEAFRGLEGNRRDGKYRVHLVYGASFEPWIVGVENGPSQN